MAVINEHFTKLSSAYLFPRIRELVAAHRKAYPDKDIIDMGLGDVSLPLAPAVVSAMKSAVEGMAHAAGFRGYGPSLGYEFLRSAIVDNDYRPLGIDLSIDEIFVSDGTKCDLGNTQEIFGPDNIIAVQDPVFPLYVDVNVMAGRTGKQRADGSYAGIVYLPCLPENDFVPSLPKQPVDLIYLCFPNNPCGTTSTREQLKQWVAYAQANDAVILYDGAYTAYIKNSSLPKSIYELPGADQVAIEYRSFSKTAGFTGLRCGYTVIPNALEIFNAAGDKMPLQPLWRRRHNTKFNGASYITQVGAAAAYTSDGRQQCAEKIDFYLDNARIMREGLIAQGHRVYGGENAPYIWWAAPDNMASWEFFDHLLDKCALVATPGAGFGRGGEGYMRLSAFGKRENAHEAVERIAQL